MPLDSGLIPVSTALRDGLQTGAAAKALVNVAEVAASRSRFGVETRPA